MIPEYITTRDEAYNWLLRHGYSVDLANEELDAWEAGEAPASDEPEIILSLLSLKMKKTYDGRRRRI